MLGSVPKVLGRVPKVLGRVPKVLGSVPKVFGRVSRVLGRVPKVLGSVSMVLGRVHRVLGRVPKVLDLSPGLSSKKIIFKLFWCKPLDLSSAGCPGGVCVLQAVVFGPGSPHAHRSGPAAHSSGGEFSMARPS